MSCAPSPRPHSLYSCSNCKSLFRRPGINPHFLGHGRCPNCRQDFAFKPPILFYIRIPKYQCWACDRLMMFNLSGGSGVSRCDGCGMERVKGSEVQWVRSLRIEDDPELEIRRHMMGRGCRKLPCCSEGGERHGVKMWVDVEGLEEGRGREGVRW